VEIIQANGLANVQILQRGRNARTGAKESQVSLILAERPAPTEAIRPQRSQPPLLDHQRLRQTLQRVYARVALFPERSHPWPVGVDHAVALGYPSDVLSALATAATSFCGVAYPFTTDSPRPGEVVVDVGAGSGLDALVAARLVGSKGQVVGIEMTAELLRKATLAGRQVRAKNLRFENGIAEAMPVADGFADVVIANGVVNLLVADKEQALAEIWRVLKPGGRLLLADVVVRETAPRAERAVPDSWAELAGPLPEAELLDMLQAVDFADVLVRERGEVRVGDGLVERARALGAERVLIVARKPGVANHAQYRNAAQGGSEG
jgi:SAM-dependent methyltransferase